MKGKSNLVCRTAISTLSLNNYSSFVGVTLFLDFFWPGQRTLISIFFLINFFSYFFKQNRKKKNSVVSIIYFYDLRVLFTISIYLLTFTHNCRFRSRLYKIIRRKRKPKSLILIRGGQPRVYNYLPMIYLIHCVSVGNIKFHYQFLNHGLSLL